MSKPLPVQWDASGCLRIGVLHDFVQHMDEGADAHSLHHLTGQLHLAANDKAAKLSWVAAVRERFAGAQATCFECDLTGATDDLVMSDPADRFGCRLALHAIKTSLQEVEVGEAVLYAAETATEPKEGRMCVTAAAVKCTQTRAVGIFLARPLDMVGDRNAVMQYLAALAWHLRCADVTTARIKTLARRPSPMDLLGLLPLPCLLTDGAGRSIDRNGAFGEFMEGAGVRVTTGRLQFDDPYVQNSWRVALSEVEATAVRQSMLVAARDGRHWRVHLVPLRYALDPEDPTERQMIVVIVEQQIAAAEDASLENMETLRPLTRAEQDVLDAVLQGHSAKVIATSRGASVNTVRSQIMAILDKTGHHNQKSLMAAFAPSGFRHSMSSSFNTPVPASRPGTKR